MRHSAQFLLVGSLAMVALVHASELVPALDLEDGRIAAKDTVVATVQAQSPSADPTADALPDVDLAILLDPDADPDARQAQLRLLEARAAQGTRWSNYVLGSLYRLGKQHPAELVERDADRATVHLRQAALAGETYAMSGLSELLLLEGEPRAALVWAHAFVHYRRVFGQLAGHPSERRQAYAASLLLRCRSTMERSTGDRSPIQADLDEFVARHDAGIRAGMIESLQATADTLEARPNNALTQVSSRTLRRSMVEAGEPGLALYRIGVGRDGRVKRVLIVDTAPDRRFGWRMRSIARATRFNPSPGADPLRWAVLPMQFDDHSVSLRPRNDDEGV